MHSYKPCVVCFCNTGLAVYETQESKPSVYVTEQCNLSIDLWTILKNISQYAIDIKRYKYADEHMRKQYTYIH